MIATEEEKRLLRLAVELSGQCGQSVGAFSVGAIITTEDGEVLATGYSRELGSSWHAEEVAFEKARRDNLSDKAKVLFTSLEPCSIRKSGREPCCSRILASAIRRVIYGLREPRVFVDCNGVAVLSAAGITVVQYREYEPLVKDINSHLLGVRLTGD